jgi:outer membrane protein assembly factor BamB
VRAADGKEVWRRQFPDGVLGRLAVDRWRVFAGCRDRHCYCLDRADGGEVWKRDLGSPVVSAPAVELDPASAVPVSPLYVAASGGALWALAPDGGKVLWALDLGALAGADRMEVVGSPALERRDGEGRRLYVAATLVSTGRTGEVYCLEERRAKEE